MKKNLLLIALICASYFTYAQTQQWASSVISFSSQWSSTEWSANQVIGQADTYPECGDIPTAWATTNADGMREFIEVAFATPGTAGKIEVFETNCAGAVDTVYVRQQGTTIWTKVYETTAAATDCRILTIPVTGVTFNVDAVRIAINSPAVPGFNEIDAIRLTSLPPIVTISNASIFEGNAGTSQMNFTVTLSKPSDSTVTVHYKTKDKTATAGSDYNAANGKLKFNPGQTSKTIPVTIIGDVNIESDETFFVILSNPVNAILGNSKATGKIKNDDGSPLAFAKTNDASIASSIILFPNPVKDMLAVSGVKTGVTIYIYNASGNQVIQQYINTESQTINVSKLPAGVYVLRFIQDAKTQTFKFIKE